MLRLWYSSPAYRLWFELRQAYWRQFLCPKGIHDTATPIPGQTANFCGACHKQVNPNAFQPWIVTLNTGELHEVMATNEKHARSLVIYGSTGPLRMNERGQPIGAIKVHPENIVEAWCLTRIA